MSLAYKGALSISALCPFVMSVIGDVSLAISASFNGSLALSASLSLTPPTLVTTLAALAELEAQITAAAALGLPNVSFNLSMAAALVAKLNLSLGLLASLDALVNANVGIFGYSYVGAGNALGSALTTELATQWPDGTPTSGTCTAFIFGCVANPVLDPPDIAAEKMEEFLPALPYTPGLNYAGQQLSIGDICPSVKLSLGQGESAIRTQLAGALALQASLSVTPPTFSATLEALAKFQASLIADAELALPKVQFAVDATASLAADLQAKFDAVIALGDIIARLDAQAFIYRYTGPANAMGADVSATLASFWGDGTTPTGGPCTTVVLGATDPATTTAMSLFFGGA